MFPSIGHIRRISRYLNHILDIIELSERKKKMEISQEENIKDHPIMKKFKQ
jgi:hypothetical protein